MNASKRMDKEIFEAIKNAIIDGRSNDWIMNNVIGCGWDQDEFYDFCQELDIVAELKPINVRDRWIELAEQCWDGFYETDWDEDDPSFEVEE